MTHLDRQLRQQREHYHRAKGQWKFYTMRLSHEDYADLQRLAKQKRTSVNELVRTFITWGMESGE